MIYIKRFEKYYNFKIGEYVISPLGKFKVVNVFNNTLEVENDDGYRAEFFKKDFIPEIEYYLKKYNL